MSRVITYTEALREATREAMVLDDSVICYGLGVSDPKSVFGTTEGLREEFGEHRAFDIPTSENAVTGIGVGAALGGLRPVITHQRMDFFLLAMEQLINNAAKWNYMFNGQASIPLTIRVLVGRGWGQGPTHSQTLQSWFAHVPGLKVVMPAFAADAKGLLMESIFDNNPVIFIEHRWLYNQEADVPEGDYRVPLGKANVIKEGEHVTLIGMSYFSIDAMRAADGLEEQGISCEVIDLRTVAPIDWETVFRSVRKTGRLIALDTSWEACSIAGEIVARTSMDLFHELKSAPRRIGLPFYPVPAGYSLTRDFYPGAKEIASTVGELMGENVDLKPFEIEGHHDVPGAWFKGPF